LFCVYLLPIGIKLEEEIGYLKMGRENSYKAEKYGIGSKKYEIWTVQFPIHMVFFYVLQYCCIIFLVVR
jgi:hypothetical protein